MRRWNKKKLDDDDALTFDDLEDEEEEEEESRPRRRTYAPPRPIRTHYNSDDYEGDDDAGPTFDELEPKIRAGKYKPKKTDPWNAIVLYNLLKESGEI